MPSDSHDLVARYRSEPDEALLAALATGASGYTPAAWRVITDEAARRQLVVTETASDPSPMVVAEPAIDPLPKWLSATLLTLSGVFLLLQILLLLAYYAVIDREHVYFGSTSTLALGLTAWSATRFVRVGPHAPIARRLGLAAIGLTIGAILLRL
jgi:hypothetical protein